MKFWPRIQSCAGAVFLFIFYFTCRQTTIISGRIPSAWPGQKFRIVVFGDDWSDTGQYRASTLRHPHLEARDPDQGEVWVETLCKELGCEIDNFAQSRPLSLSDKFLGSLIDLDIYSLAKLGQSDDGTFTCIDFKTQMQQFQSYNKGSRYSPGQQRPVDDRTIYTVYFGLWDIVEYAKLQKDIGMRAIESSIIRLFQGLDKISENGAKPIKVVLPRMLDVTFFPHFHSWGNGQPGQYAEEQHHLIFLWRYWNIVLFRTANQWRNGHVFMPDTNNLIMEQVRAAQTHTKSISDPPEQTPHVPLFHIVDRPCLVTGTSDDSASSQKTMVTKCAEPDQHLFWDDLHLGRLAQQLIGREAAMLIRMNWTINIDESKQEAIQGAKRYVDPEISFDLRYPPEY